MASSSASIPNYDDTATLTWTIDNFAQLHHRIESPVFSSPNSPNLFMSVLDLFQKGSKISLSLLYNGSKENARFYYRYSILGKNGVKHHTREFFWDYDKSLANHRAHRSIYKTRDKCYKLLVNGSLKIAFEVAIVDKKSTPSYIESYGQLTSNYETLLESGKFSDFTVQIGDKQFRVHKNILSTRSPVFAAMFEHEDTKEVKDGRVVIEDVEVKVFELLIRYIYTGKVDNLDEHAAELLVAADKYQLDLLKSICEEWFSLTLTAETVSGALLLADMHNAEKLKSKCMKYIVKDVMQTQGWKELAKTSRADLVMGLLEKLAIKDE